MRKDAVLFVTRCTALDEIYISQAISCRDKEMEIVAGEQAKHGSHITDGGAGVFWRGGGTDLAGQREWKIPTQLY